jgi:hypothetical protein
MSTADSERVDLVKLAKAQRQLLYAIGAVAVLVVAQIFVAVNIADEALARLSLLALLGLQLAAAGVSIALTAKMSRAASVGWGSTACICAAQLIPFLNIVLLAGLNARVLTLLSQRRVKVGLMGVPRTEMLKLIEGTCVCGYDLRGLGCPVCPECGSPIAAAGRTV